MAINITDSGSTIKIEITADYESPRGKLGIQTIYLGKEDSDVKGEGVNVTIWDKTREYVFRYSDIMTPSGASAEAVAALIEAFFDTANAVSLGASELHVGQVGGTTVKKTINVVTTAGAYAAGDNIGGKMTLSDALRISGGSGKILDLIVIDKDSQSAPLVLDLWDASPDAGTHTNNDPDVPEGDEAKHLGSIAVAAGDYVATGTESRAHLKNIGAVIIGNASKDIKVTMSTTGTPTYSTTAALILKFGIDQD